MEAKKRKVEEARASSSNPLDFHDVVDDRVEKNPCSDSSDIHESSINTISTAFNVTIAAPLLACTTHLTSPVASTSANISCITLIIDSDTPGYDEPKFIMFYSMLLQLFTTFCFNCKGNSPKATMRQCGTLVKVLQTCSQCHQEYSWKSQPTSVDCLHFHLPETNKKIESTQELPCSGVKIRDGVTAERGVSLISVVQLVFADVEATGEVKWVMRKSLLT
ncbi:hypothetical protein pdam_00017572 [Pocillopora damicornis]|uniref:Uncharacterized protein n=1 Tax=Pocillopora damicornis TaxID=46731 RepID=A0A3M6TRF0_POCDA|nr:hypothetical protein pdam_00017572 [Pocillopora damicornis]